MDFSGIKAITLPEGNVKSLAIGGVTVWTAPSATYTPVLPADTAAFPLYRDGTVLEFAVTDGTRFGYYAPSTGRFTAEAGMAGTVIERVEYVTLSGSEHVSTGVALQGSDTVEIDFLYTTSGANIFGSWRSSNTDVFTLYASTSSSYVRYASSLYRNTPVTTNTRHVFRMTPTGDYVDGTRYHTWAASTFNSATPCLVGWLNGSTSPHMKGNVYDFEIAGKSHLVPVKIGSSYYLFDTKQWNLPTHTGTLTGGPVVQEPIEFPESVYTPPAMLMMGGNPNMPPSGEPEEGESL